MTSNNRTDKRELLEASLHLTGWILAEAARCAEVEGFGWAPSATPPDGFQAVKLAYQHCKATGERFPVATSGSETSIYAGAECNHAFRFLHDMAHIRLDMGFTPDTELWVAVEHLNALVRAGYAVGSLEWYLLLSDTVGQIVAGQVLHRFVYDQLAFNYDCVLLGFKRAVEIESTRTQVGSHV